MLAAASPLGNNYLLIVGPLVVVVAMCVWIGLTVAARRKNRPARGHTDQPHRGAVQGGVLEGDPGQRNRRDEAPRQD
jgi:hypothetical protein